MTGATHLDTLMRFQFTLSRHDALSNQVSTQGAAGRACDRIFRTSEFMRSEKPALCSQAFRIHIAGGDYEGIDTGKRLILRPQ